LVPTGRQPRPCFRLSPARGTTPRYTDNSRKPKRENVMHDKQVAAPGNTAVRVALWRALHVEVDSPPHVLEDEIGLKLAAPEDGWRSRPDMSPFTRPFRASIVARARFIEDLVAEQAASTSASASRRSCGSCQSTSRQATGRGSGWQRRASIPGGRRSWRPPVSACT